MADGKVVTLRFKLDNDKDMEIYQWLNEIKTSQSISLAECVKIQLVERMQSNIEKKSQDRLVMMVKDELDQNLDLVRKSVQEELESLSAILLRTIVRMGTFNEGSINSDQTVSVINDNNAKLPDVSEVLPDKFDDILDQFV